MPRGGEDQLGVGRGAVVVDLEDADRDALRRSATPSAFQKPVAASTLPAAREEIALKPIVTRSTAAGSPPSALTSESTTASSEGRPVTPTVWPSRSRGRAHRAVGAGDHRGQRALHDRHHADQVEAALAGDPEVVDVEDREVGAAGREQLRRVGRFARLADVEVDPGVSVEALGRGRVDAGVDRVRGEIEHQRRAFRRARFSAVPAAAGGAGEQQGGRQQRGNSSHLARNAIRLSECG